MRSLKVLFVENAEDDILLSLHELRLAGFDVSHHQVDTPHDLKAALGSAQWDVIVCDYWMPSFTGRQALEIYKQFETDVPFVIVSGSITDEAAVEAMRAGAHDYVLKDNLKRLGPAVERELRQAQNRRDKAKAENERRRQAEELDLHVQELRRSNKELERFAYVAAHDLQEPLRVIATHSQLLERRLTNKLDSESEAVLATIRTAALRMESLIRGLLSYSKAIHDREDHREFVCVADIVREILDQSLNGRIKDAGAVITADELPEVYTDRMGLRQVFENLLSNALKYRHRDRSPQIHIGAKHANGEYVFWVRDNGIGIEKEYFERIFEIFRRLHRQDEYPGTGVGLSVAKCIIDRYHGQMWVESTPGEGSIFYFTISNDVSARAQVAR
jgi:light-regulated signal transduction histidine kinase (bacteriophytochrome)